MEFTISADLKDVDESLTPKMGHQGLLVIAVDQRTMTGEIIDYDLWHSFLQ